MQAIKRWGLIFAVTIKIVIVALGIYQWWVHAPLPPFDNVSGLGAVGLWSPYDRIIGTMGAPHDVEIIERDNASHVYALHYDGISFFLRGDTNTVFILT